MNILNALKQLRDDIKTWVTNNLNALNAKIEEKTIPIDSELNSTSTNPVQNKAIAEEIKSINNRVGNTSVATQISNAINKVPTFSGDYNDLVNAPNISEDGLGDMIIADESGNIIFRADADGIHTTSMTLNGESVEAMIDDKVDKIEGKGLSTNDFTNEYKEKIDNLNEGGGGVVVEEDPTVPAWAKAESKPNYTAEEVGALANTTVLADLAEDATHRTVTDEEKAIWNNKVDSVEGKQLSTNDFTNEYKTKLDNINQGGVVSEEDPTVPAWAKEPTKPTYTASEVGLGNVDNTSDADKPVSTATQTAINDLKSELSESIVSENNEWKVVDETGNIIFSVDAEGAHTTSLTLNGQPIEDMLNGRVDANIPVFDLEAMGMETHNIGQGMGNWLYCDTTEILAAMRKGAVGFIVPTNYGNVAVFGTSLEVISAQTPQIVCSFSFEGYYGDVFIVADNESIVVESTFRTTPEQIIDEVENKGYQTQEQVTALIDNALGVIENGTY